MIELPGWLEWLEPIVGMEWPEGNEDQMWALAQDWHTAAADLRTILGDIDAAKSASLTAYPAGEGVEEMIKGFDSLRSGDGSEKDQSLEKLATLFDQIGESANSVGTEIEYAKLMYWSSLGLLAAELAAAWLFPPTAPAVEAAAIGLTRVAVRIIGQRVVAAIIRHVGKLVASKFAKFMLRHVAIDTMLGTLQELGVQQWQVDQGHRKNINWEQVAVTAVSSAAGGAAAGPFGDWLGNKLSGEMKPWMRAAITGPAAGLVGAGAGFVAATGTQFGIDAAKNGWGDAWNNLKNTQVDWRMFTAGASNGAMSAVNKVGAQHAWGSMRPEMFGRPDFGTRFADAVDGPGGAQSTDGARVGFRPDGAGDGSRAAAGDGSTGAAGDGNRTAGDGGRSGSDGSATRPAGAEGQGRVAEGDAGRQNGSDGAERGSAGEGRGSAEDGRRAPGESDGGASRESDSGASRDSTSRSGDSARSAGSEAASESRAGDAAARTGDGSTGRPTEGSSANPDHVAAQTDSSGAADQRAGLAAQDAVHSSDGRIDATTTGNDPVTAHTGLADGGPVTTAPSHPPATHPSAAPPQQSSTGPVTGGENRSSPGSSSPLRPVTGEVRPHTGADAPRIEQPRTGAESRAGAPDGRATGEARTPPRAGDVRGESTGGEPRRSGLADGSARGNDHRSGLQSGSSGESVPRGHAAADGSTSVRQPADGAIPVSENQLPARADSGGPLDVAGVLPLAAAAGAEATPTPRPERAASPDSGQRAVDEPDAPRPERPETEHPRDCAIRSLELIRDLTGSAVIEVPTREIGLDGVSQSEIEHAAGAPLRDVENHNVIRDALLYETGPDGSVLRDADGNPIERPDGVAALVVDVYGKVDEHNVGAHAYVLVKEDGAIVVRDLTAGLEHGFPPILPDGDHPVALIRTILFDENGIPQQHNESGASPRDSALHAVDVGERPPVPGSDPAEPASNSNGGGKKPPSELPPPASPDDPGEHAKPNSNRDNDSDDSPVLEPDEIVLADDTRPHTVDIDGEQVPLALRPDGEDRWRAVPAADGEVPARRENSSEVEKKSAVRRAWERFRDRTHVRGYEGDNPKYPSGSGEDGRGQTALRDGVASAPDLFDPPPAPAPHVPANPDVPTMGPAPEPGAGNAPNVARILKEGATMWKNRELVPLLGQLSGRERDVAGDFVPPRTADGEEYRFWVSDADPDLVRETVTDLYEVGRMSAEEVRAVLTDALTVSDPEQRRRIVDDMARLGLISDAEAEQLAQQPPAPEPIAEPDGPPPADESLSDMAERLGFELPDDDPATVRRTIDEQEYRTLREAAAVEGLADAYRRFNEEQTRPYTREDVVGQDSRPPLEPGESRNRPPRELEGPDARRRDEDDADFYLEDDEFDEDGAGRRPARQEPDPAGQPIPYADEVSFFDENPMGRFLKEINAAFDGMPGVQNYTPVGNGADPLKEWGDIGPDDDELGRDQGPRAYFEHALRRDQLRDELSTWAQMFGLDIDSVTIQRIEELRAANQARADRLAEFADAAEIRLYPASDDQPPVGQPFGDQVVRIPVGEGVPDRLVVIDGPQDRATALARVLAEHPDLAQAVNRGEVQVDFHKARTDRNGRIHLEPVGTPEVYHHRERVDGRDLAVTLLRDSDGQWRPVVLDDTDAPRTEPDPVDTSEAPPRPRPEILADLVDVARTLGLEPDALHPDRLAQTIADLKLDNAVRAGQIEALADFARSMNDIASFNDISDARSQLATRLGIPEAELSPQRLADALTDSSFRNALRAQQVADLVAYAKQLRDLDPAAFVAARDQLAKRLGVEPSELFPPKYSKNEAGRLVHGLDSNSLDPKKLRKLFAQLERDGRQDLLKNALTEYTGALIRVDPYSDVPRGDLSADPRVTGEPPIHDPEAIHALRDIIRDAMQSGDPLDFGQTLADHPGRQDGDGTWNRDSDNAGDRPDPNRDWARLVGVDLADADDATFRKVYEAYRDGKIEKHEGLNPQELAAEIAKMRDEVRQRAAQIRDLAALAEEFYAAPEQLPGGAQRGRPGDGPGTPLDGPDGDPPTTAPPATDPPPRQPSSGGAEVPPVSRDQPTAVEPKMEDSDSSVRERDTEPGMRRAPEQRSFVEEVLRRETEALDEALRHNEEWAQREHQRLMDELAQRRRDIAARFDAVIDGDGADAGLTDKTSAPEAENGIDRTTPIRDGSSPETDSGSPAKESPVDPVQQPVSETPTENAPERSSRIDAALARELAALDESYRRHAEEADAELQRVLDRLEQVGRELDEPLQTADLTPESEPVEPVSRIDAALARELAKVDEAYRRHAEWADSELRQVLDRLEQIGRELGVPDSQPDSVDARTRIDEALTRELAALDESYRRHAEEADAELQRVLDRLEQVGRELNESLDAHESAPEPDSSARIDDALSRELAKVDEAYRRHAAAADAHLRRTLDRLDRIRTDLAAQSEHQRLMGDLDAAHREIADKFAELEQRDTSETESAETGASQPGKPGAPDESAPQPSTDSRTNRADDDDPPKPPTPEGDSPRIPQLPGRALRSHIPHPPRDYEFEFPDPIHPTPLPWPVPDPQPPTPPTLRRHPNPHPLLPPHTRPHPLNPRALRHPHRRSPATAHTAGPTNRARAAGYPDNPELAGAAWDSGSAGFAGPAWDSGSAGFAGAAWDSGSAGFAGAARDSSSAEHSSSAGLADPAGYPGAAGRSRAAGYSGAAGSAGPAGYSDAAGVSGSAERTGAARAAAESADPAGSARPTGVSAPAGAFNVSCAAEPARAAGYSGTPGPAGSTRYPNATAGADSAEPAAADSGPAAFAYPARVHGATAHSAAANPARAATDPGTAEFASAADHARPARVFDAGHGAVADSTWATAVFGTAERAAVADDAGRTCPGFVGAAAGPDTELCPAPNPAGAAARLRSARAGFVGAGESGRSIAGCGSAECSGSAAGFAHSANPVGPGCNPGAECTTGSSVRSADGWRCAIRWRRTRWWVRATLVHH
ncbi:hypothetical protein [Nocardia brasiliensis]|uniref:WXG100-like domain-containing protein n=1 Tax=Nocardia brasiliensis TaxID=37326 RepID=UPI003D91353A